MHYLEWLLETKFMDILKKHGNCKWAYEELDWWIFTKCYEFYKDLPEEDKWVVINYIDALKKLHG